MISAAKPILKDASPAIERHYDVAEIAELWKVSRNTVRRLFQQEPGVLTIGEPRPKFGRRRVHRRMCVSSA
jgi:hypothetical protein